MDYYKLKVLNHKKLFVFIVLTLIIILGGGYYYFYEMKDKGIEINDILNDDKTNEEKDEKETYEIIVDIKGHVAKPGVYAFKMDDNARINDLILKAGGLLKDADTSTINLSKKLDDEMTIIIYSKSEIQNYVNTKKELENKLEMCEQKLKNNACLSVGDEKNKKININTASQEELMTLSGIGEGKAKAIIEYRKKKSFENIDDLKNVDGIGESLFESLRENITV